MGKFGSYSSITDPDDSDLFLIEDTSVPETKKIRIDDVRDDQDALTALTDVDTDDELPIYDQANSFDRKKITVSDLFDQHGDLTNITDLDDADEIEFYDNSDSDSRKKATRSDLLDDFDDLTSFDELTGGEDELVASDNGTRKKVTWAKALDNIQAEIDKDLSLIRANHLEVGNPLIIPEAAASNVENPPSGYRKLFFDTDNNSDLTSLQSDGTTETHES